MWFLANFEGKFESITNFPTQTCVVLYLAQTNPDGIHARKLPARTQNRQALVLTSELYSGNDLGSIQASESRTA